MKKYFAVDCDNPVPNFLDDESVGKACPIDMKKRIWCSLRENIPTEDGANILIGVIRGNVLECEMVLQIVVQTLNILCGDVVFEDYCVLNVETGNIEAGLASPPDINSELHILSDRPRTLALFKDKNCWWNKHSKLKRSIGKLSKHKRKNNARRRPYREGCPVLHVCASRCRKSKDD